MAYGTGDDQALMQKEINDLKIVIKLYDDAVDKFIAKCKDGRARSNETLKELTEARNQSKIVNSNNYQSN